VLSCALLRHRRAAAAISRSIDPASAGVGAGQTPPGGREWRNDFGDRGRAGPQPPVGDKAHRYVFGLYALAGAIRLPAEPTADDIHRLVDDSALAHGSLCQR